MTRLDKSFDDLVEGQSVEDLKVMLGAMWHQRRGWRERALAAEARLGRIMEAAREPEPHKIGGYRWIDAEACLVCDEPLVKADGRWVHASRAAHAFEAVAALLDPVAPATLPDQDRSEP